MQSKLGVLLAAFAVLCLAWSGPAGAQTGSYPLADTRWNGSVSFESGNTLPLTNVQFRQGGVLVYTDDEGTWSNGRWRERELLVTFEMNDYFVLFGGLQNDADHMSGAVYNKNGERGTWSLTRQR